MPDVRPGDLYSKFGNWLLLVNYQKGSCGKDVSWDAHIIT